MCVRACVTTLTILQCSCNLSIELAKYIVQLCFLSVFLAFAGEIIELITGGIENDDDNDDLIHLGIPSY